MKAKVHKVSLMLLQGDVLDQAVDAVVVDTDRDLHLTPKLVARAGLSLQREVATIGYTEVGGAVLTSGGGLAARAIIHAVTPRWGEGSERGKLSSAVFNALKLAEAHKLKKLAFPALATGAYGYPVEACASVMLSTIIDFTFEPLRALRQIMLCLDDKPALAAFERELAEQLETLREDGGTAAG